MYDSKAARQYFVMITHNSTATIVPITMYTTSPRMQEAKVRPNNKVEALPLVPAKHRRFTIQGKFGLLSAAHSSRLIARYSYESRCGMHRTDIHHTMYGVWKRKVEAMMDRKSMQSKSFFGPCFLFLGSTSRGAPTIHL